MKIRVARLSALLLGVCAATGTISASAQEIRVGDSMLATTGAAIKDGEVWVWGFRGSAQQGNGVTNVASTTAPTRVAGLSNVKTVTGGLYHLAALTEDGSLYTWGRSGFGETGCSGYYIKKPCNVADDLKFKQVVAGAYFTLALTEDGDVLASGHNAYGQLGDGTFVNKNHLVYVQLNEKVRLIGAAYEGGFAVTESNKVYAWGDNESSGLGFTGPAYGTREKINVPREVPNLAPYAADIKYIGGGNGWGEALLNDGRVLGWGVRMALGVGQHSSKMQSADIVVVMDKVDQLFARYLGSYALTTDGYMLTWGQTGCCNIPQVYGYYPTLRYQYDRSDPPVMLGGGKEHLFYSTESNRLFGVGYDGNSYKLNLNTSVESVDWPGGLITFP